jgi:hypothetical protein
MQQRERMENKIKVEGMYINKDLFEILIQEIIILILICLINLNFRYSVWTRYVQTMCIHSSVCDLSFDD